MSAKWTLRLALSFGFIFILSVGAAIIALHVAADRQLKGEAVLARLRANVAQMSVIEYHWRINGGISPGLDSKAGEGTAEERLALLTTSLKQDSLQIQALTKDSAHGGGLIVSTDAYVRAVERLRSLYLEKNTVLAFAYDDHNVDNAYTSLNAKLDEAEVKLKAASVASRSLASVGTLFALIVQFAILAFATHRLSASREKGAALTAQRQTLQLSERRLGVLIGNVNAVVSVIDREGNFTYTSPQTERYFGFIPGRISDLLDLTNADGGAIVELLEKREGEIEVSLRVGEDWREFLLQSRSLFDDPAVQGQVLVWHDITLTKQAQKAIEEARDTAVHLSKLKSEFLANMSHEIRTPMNGVLGMVDLLLDTELSDIQSDYTETIRSCGTALMSLLNDILDFSKLESGRLILEEIAFDPAQVAEESADLVRAIASKKGLELIVAVDDVQWIYGDPMRLRQVILNLLSNAVKFTSEGEVLVRVQCTATEGSRTRVRFSVKDSGIGIPEEKLHDIFGAFVQVDGSTTRMFGGTGLGLSISRQIVGMMGGELRVTSKIGEGSEFYFEFEAQLTEADKRTPSSGALDGKRVLIVDDSETNLTVLSGLLGRWGCYVEQASDALQALERTNEASYDLIVLDNLMPDVDGIELAKRLQQKGITTPIVLLTSVGAPLDLNEMRSIGVRQCLSKPARRPDLLQALVQSLSEHPEEVQPSPVLQERSHTRVLVVEDNPVNQVVAKKLLSNLGCTVDVASGGGEALELLGQDVYDLVFMDCLMPDLDGYETTRLLRNSEEPWKRSIPIIALTASAMEGDRARCLACGMDDYVSKPVNRAALLKVLERWRLPSAA